jgi:hypothetical protein
MTANPLTLERLREVLDYDPKTGVFRWKISKKHFIGKAAGYLNKDGHRQIRVDGRAYYAHRLAWLYVRGEWPDRQIDHRDTNRDNNAFRNLREATNLQNQQNSKPRRSDGRKGIHFTHGTWQAAIRVNGKRLYLGRHNTPDEAAAAYARAATEHHGQFARIA